jgi:hypothetical protein
MASWRLGIDLMRRLLGNGLWYECGVSGVEGGNKVWFAANWPTGFLELPVKCS